MVVILPLLRGGVSAIVNFFKEGDECENDGDYHPTIIVIVVGLRCQRTHL